MDVFLTGGSGFIGTALCHALLADGHEVTVLTRRLESAAHLPPAVGRCLGDPTRPGAWQEEAARHQGFVNLAGASIFGRWSRGYKEVLRRSRIASTRNLVAALAECEEPPVLVSASAVGYYGPHGDEELDESAPPGEDFLARLCRDWEAAAQEAEAQGARVVRARFGIVLGWRGGALARMLRAFRLGLGGPLGSGRQWVSWVHLDDVVEAVLTCLEHPTLAGAFNFTAPAPVTNRELTRTLGRVLGRPSWLRVPAWVVRLVWGEMGSVLLTGQRVLPRALERAGFVFRHPELEGALRDLLA